MKSSTRDRMTACAAYVMKGGFVAGFIWGLTWEEGPIMWLILNAISAGFWCCAPGAFLLCGFKVAEDERMKRG